MRLSMFIAEMQQSFVRIYRKGKVATEIHVLNNATLCWALISLKSNYVHFD